MERTLVHLHERHLLFDEQKKIHRIELGLAAMPALRVQRGLQQIDVADTRDFDGVLKREKESLARPFLGRKRQQIPIAIPHRAARHVIVIATGQYMRKRALARPVRPHDRVHFARVHAQVEPAQNRLAFHVDVQIADFKHH
jgi:hypothetical protein